MGFHVPAKYRVMRGPFASSIADGNNGLFFVPNYPGTTPLRVIASDGMGSDGAYWEHVSVRMPDRCPTWEQMCRVKALFWDEGDCVMQLHPPKEDWVNNHSYCLHLWRPVGKEIPRPCSLMVGIKELGVLA